LENNYSLKTFTLGLFLSSFCFSSTLFASDLASIDETDATQIKAIIAAVERGWEQGDGTPFRKHFLDFPEARYYESGGQNIGLEDLVTHHVEPEKDALEFLDIDYQNIRVFGEGNFAWALADTKVKGKVKGKDIVFDKKGHQTFLFRKTDGVWKVIHTHSSSRDRKK